MFFDPRINVTHLKAHSLVSFSKESFKYGKSHARIFLSGKGASKTSAYHPGALFLAEPVIISTALISLAFGFLAFAFLGGCALAGIFFYLSLKQQLMPKISFFLVSFFRAILWTLGGVAGALEFVKCRLS